MLKNMVYFSVYITVVPVLNDTLLRVFREDS